MDKKKIGITCICLNAPYWQYASEMLDGLNRYFLKHPSIKDKYTTDIMLWSDIPEDSNETTQILADWLAYRGELKTSIVSQTEAQYLVNDDKKKYVEDMIHGVVNLREKGMTIFPTEPIEWPMPTLLRYNLFLQQEEKLKEYDYIFYIDVDMRITDWIGEEILNDSGLTLALHPMYALREGYFFPYDPNPNSEAYIRLPGRYIDDGKGGKKFRPEYYAGGFQGGKTDIWISAMKEMKRMTEKDLNNNYIPRWNDESIMNSYIFRHPELDLKVLDPGYIYPDSLIAEYYTKAWGRNYSPKIMTLTKKFSTTNEAGKAISEQLATL